ncbi:hypothetical protein HYU12_01265 [Candidatus Woesearchaeota archaeon]|nr:hypothetical protein [Candidatus Woesearchaeota archaeon]
MNLLHSRKALFGGPGGGGPRQPISILLGLAFLALGIVPLLKSFGVVDFSIPAPAGMVLWILAAAGGLVLLWDAMSEKMPGGESTLKTASLLAGLIVLAFGIIPILNNAGMIGFSIPDFGEMVINILFTVVGLLLVYGASKQI